MCWCLCCRDVDVCFYPPVRAQRGHAHSNSDGSAAVSRTTRLVSLKHGGRDCDAAKTGRSRYGEDSRTYTAGMGHTDDPAGFDRPPSTRFALT
jgi:hypothetical protein